MTLAPVLVFLICSLGTGLPAYADSSSSRTSSADGQAVSVFRDRNVSITVSGGVATAINECVNDASDGVIQNQRTACQQAASAGNVVDGAITVYQSKNVAITVSGGVATAINECVNDASDGVVQNQRTACEQAASAGNVVAVSSITISTAKNIAIDITGGTAVVINECVNNASGGATQNQQNTCVQVGSSGNIVDVGSVYILTSKNITINITGGVAMALFTCLSSASGGGVVTQKEACTQVAQTGNSTSVGRILIRDSKNVIVTVDGKVVTTIRNGVIEVDRG
ncbi:MAG TPA: hypothetical protein VI248_26300 [Kineosporiaceae bacterium]